MRGSDVQYGGVTLLASPEGRGTVLVDASLEVHRRGGVSDAVDLVAISHAPEDHLAGPHRSPHLPVLAHPAEVGAVRNPGVGLQAPGWKPTRPGSFADSSGTAAS